MLRGASSAQSLSECPYCHQPLRTPSPDEGHPLGSDPSRRSSFVNPEYFRMLRLASEPGSEDDIEPPSSPIRRLTQPVHRHEPSQGPRIRRGTSAEGISEADGAEFITSS